MKWINKIPALTPRLVPLVLFVLASCSNPLSSNKNQTPQIFHSKNQNCSQLKFSSATFSATQIRSLVHCINSNHEIDAIETLLDQTSDMDLEPFAALLSDVIQNQSKALFAFRETYLKAKKEGDLTDLENKLVLLFSDKALNQELAKLVRKNSKPISELLMSESFKLNLAGIYSLTHANAFQRLGEEMINEKYLNLFLESVTRYLNQSDSKTLFELYQMLEKHQLGIRFKELTRSDEKQKIKKIAHFMDWLFSNTRYSTLSTGARSILKDPITCFNQSQEIKNPISSALSNISTKDDTLAAQFFSHDIKNLFLVAQGYCNFSYQMSPLLNLLDEATTVDGFEETYSLFKPLLNDSSFVDWIASSASEQFVRENTWLSEKHFFLDLLNALLITERSPIATDGASLAKFLDQTLKNLNKSEMQSLNRFLTLLLNDQNQFGLQLSKTLYKISNSMPAVSIKIGPSFRKSISSSIESILKKEAISENLNLISKLIRDQKIRPLIDQTLLYFQTLLDRGRFNFRFSKFLDPQVLDEPLSFWLLEKMFPKNPDIVDDLCKNQNFDWNFSLYSKQSSKDYQKQMDILLNCTNPNQTFKSANDLVQYAINQNLYSPLLSVQSEVINSAFKLNTRLSLETAKHWIDLSKNDLSIIRKFLVLSSKSVSLIKDSFLQKVELRNYFKRLLNGNLIYQTIVEWGGPTPKRLRSSQANIDLLQLKKIDVLVTKEQSLNQVNIEDAMKALFSEYCPTLDDNDRNCDIDSDQIALYKISPATLYQEIVGEYLNSNQTWLHPLNFKSWRHVKEDPEKVSDFEFHLNPMLHSFRDSPQVPGALLNALKRIRHDKMDIAGFLRPRALKIKLMPYIYQNPNYPQKSRREYGDRIRLRIASDLDRLELIPINADFKAFDTLKNFGMGFIREIGLAWGDVPDADRPVSLKKFRSNDDALTLMEVKQLIESEMIRYDRRILQTLGNCDPRGRGRLKRWLTCNDEISDLHARVFNLRFLIGILSDELPKSDGGAGGLEFLRDLFYGLYESNLPTQKDYFANGVSLRDECLSNPLNFDSSIKKCQRDILTLIPRITHLGLLHQAGMAILNHEDHPVDQISSLIERVSENELLASKFVAAVTTQAGLQLIEDFVDYGFQAPEGVGQNLSLLAQTLSVSSDLTWIEWLLELIPKMPHFPTENQELLNALLSSDTESLKPWVDQWLNVKDSKTNLLFSSISENLTPVTRNDLTQFLQDITPVSPSLAKLVVSAKKLPPLQTNQLTQDFIRWSEELQKEQANEIRSTLANSVTKKSFENFCAVFSDTTLVEKTYNFLESIHQNPDSRIFLDSCEEFLNSR